MKLAAVSERPLAPALNKEIKSCLCERPAGKEGGVSQPQETQLISQCQISHCWIPECRFSDVWSCREHRSEHRMPAGSRGKRIPRRNYRLQSPALPWDVQLSTSSCCIRGAAKSSPGGKPAVPQACLRQTSCHLGGQELQRSLFLSLCCRSTFRSSSLAVRNAAGFTCCLHMAMDRVIPCTHA